MANKIIVVTGPHEGIGKTTLAVNLAVRYALTRRLPVVLVDTDAFCRGETGLVAGAAASLSVFQILEQLANKQISIPMLRGRIPFNRLNIGTITLAPVERESGKMTTDQWVFFLQALSQIYDVVIDLEVTSALKVVSLDLADAVVWTFLPNALSLKATLQQMEVLQNQKLGFNKFLFALNLADATPHDIPDASINDALARFNKELCARLPQDRELIHLLNQGRPSVIESLRSGYAQQVGRIADQVTALKRSAGGLLSGNGSPSSALSGGNLIDNLSKLQHTVVGSMLDEKRKRWNALKQQIHRALVEELNIRRIDLDTKGDPIRERQLRTNVESTVNSLIGNDKELTLIREDRERLVKELVDEALGLGPLEELLADPSITEIMVNRFDQVYIERRGKITLSDKRFIDNNHVVQVVRRIIAPLGRRIDESVPMVDARLKDGSRVNAIIPPLAVNGPSITIRRFPEKAFNAEDLIQMGAITRSMVEFLKVCVMTRKNMIISGGTGTGKTTILNMLSGFIPNDDRIVTVEDTAELRLQQEHVVRLEARPANIEGQGQVAIRDLVKNCLRMRPDRIVVGECRGGEALDMLQAMNTGHDGSLTTIHANSPRDAFTRLETLCLMAGMDLPVWALREQIRSAVHVVIQLARLQDGSRKVTCVTEVTGRDDETILSQDIFRFVQDTVDEHGHVKGHFESTGNVPSFFPELKAKGLSLDLVAFEKDKELLL
jgi:Flp pilus assembly CpaF family ATPase/MinD-like ATPase involved in chromosome partitioning or flagellar assembly